jgi:TolB-like protein/Tfp pilus assembly protein PilF/predicted Ser/Thr protein kinase
VHDRDPRATHDPALAGRWARVKDVFLEALDRPEPERAEYLTRACGGDDAVRREVEALLASDVAAGSFCETPAASLLAGDAPGADPTPRLQPGARLGPYELVGFVGSGGMGEVYRARDTRLNRIVAVKIVSAPLSGVSARQRLLREARHASTLRHPNICAVHEVADAGEVPYIVMEFVDGRPLSEIRQRETPGPVKAVEYGIQIADALDHAHERGIVHRDLKSSNIVIDGDDRPIVLDFGLARRLPRGEDPSAGDSTLTADHALAGTLRYMAPEVLLGARADARSDVWAIGVLLHEMAAGRLPFDGRTPFETSAAIIGEPPAPLPRNVPLALRLVIERCLTKDPAARYQRAADLRDALDAIRRRRTWLIVGGRLVPGRRHLRRAAGVALVTGVLAVGTVELVRQFQKGADPPAIPTIAVLPLENATGDPAVQYFADGLTDGLLAQIGAIGTLRVISRTSAERASSSGGSAVEIGKVLGASAVAQGSVRRVPSGVSMEVRLTDVGTGEVLWSDRFERGGREVLVLQAEVVRAIAVSVHATLQPRVRDRLAVVRAVDPETYEAYLKGRYQWNRRTREALQLAIDHYTRALEIDPTYAPAHAAIADCYNQLGTVLVGGGSPREYRLRAAAHAIKALQIDPDSAEAHAALGYVRHYAWQWQDAERALLRAIELNPSYALARLWHANLLMSLGRFEESLREVRAARDLDPFSLIANTNVGWVLHHAGRPREAADQLVRTLELDPDYPQAHWRLASARAELGDLDTALGHATRFAELTNRSAAAVTLLAQLHAMAGRPAEARRLLEELAEIASRQYVPPTAPAGAYVALGEVEAALTALERGYDDQSNLLAYLASDPSLAPIRNHPRYQALLARTGLRRP